MIITTLAQPEYQLGNEFATLLDTDESYSRIIFISAFAALRTILRLREGLLAAIERGATLRLTVGIDLGGTSREVLEELSRWYCEVFVYHNPIAYATFHPKIYLFEHCSSSTLFIGSNNLTDGGLFTNYEAATRYDFELPTDTVDYERILRPLIPFIEPNGPTVCRLNNELIETLYARGLLPTESESRQNHRIISGRPFVNGEAPPPNPFAPVAVPLPPLLPRDVRASIHHERIIETQEDVVYPTDRPRPEGLLVWRKKLTRTDALQVHPGSHHVGGIRLTQAKFENPPGQKIDQTTYFRNLFNDFDWEPERGGHLDQEHAFVPMRIIIRGNDHGIRNFEISHKPSGEASQGNYTTILRWGRNFNPVIERENLTGAVFSLYETPDYDAPFFIEIIDA